MNEVDEEKLCKSRSGECEKEEERGRYEEVGGHGDEAEKKKMDAAEE